MRSPTCSTTRNPCLMCYPSAHPRPLRKELMRLVVDANVLVAETLRERGRALLLNPELNLSITVETLSEAEHEIQRRVERMRARGFITAAVAARSLDRAPEIVSTAVTPVASVGYSPYLGEARRRIPRDPD